MIFFIAVCFWGFQQKYIFNFCPGFALQLVCRQVGLFCSKAAKKYFHCNLPAGRQVRQPPSNCTLMLHLYRLLKKSIFTTINYKIIPTFALQKRIDMDAVSFVHEQLTAIPTLPKFKAGDNITVNYKIVEGVKERIQSFKGDVIKRQGVGSTATFTVRKISDGVGVERLFPAFSPNIESIVLNKVGRVRRAKLHFLRERSGKSARIKEKRMAVGLKKGKA